MSQCFFPKITWNDISLNCVSTWKPREPCLGIQRFPREAIIFARKPGDSSIGGKPAASQCVIPELKALLPPVPSVKFLSSPLLILHGEDDRTVPLECGKKVNAEPSTTPTAGLARFAVGHSAALGSDVPGVPRA